MNDEDFKHYMSTSLTTEEMDDVNDAIEEIELKPGFKPHSKQKFTVAALDHFIKSGAFRLHYGLPIPVKEET